jgi:GT2 family glycosyltransferase
MEQLLMTTMPHSATPRCAVVVSTRGRSHKIPPLVESILRNDERDIEVVLVDQSDDDATEGAVEQFGADERFRYVRTDERGASRGRNQGIAMTTAEIVAITDDDCVVPVDWISRMLEPFQRDPRVGLVFCNVAPAPTEQPGYTPGVQFQRSSTVTNARQGWTAASSAFVLGAGMAGRRSTFEELWGFDELLGPGTAFPACEDNDLMWRAFLRGWSITRTVDTIVVHDGQRRPDEVRDLIRRDCTGAGGAIAKYLRTGHLGALLVLARAFLRFGVLEPMGSIVHGHAPRGLKRPVWMLQGLWHGLRTPVDHAAVMFSRGTVRADDSSHLSPIVDGAGTPSATAIDHGMNH